MTFLNHNPDGHNIVVDHINSNKLDNRLENLRLISNRENLILGKSLKNKTSKYTGVSFFKRDKKWRASIMINGKINNLGFFKDEYQAHLAYQNALNNLT